MGRVCEVVRLRLERRGFFRGMLVVVVEVLGEVGEGVVVLGLG